MTPHRRPSLGAAGAYRTLPPLTYSLGAAASALRQLAAARHVGKIVVAADPLTTGSTRAVRGCWAVSGGLGALGALCARWRAASGVHHIALLGRSGRSEQAPQPDSAPSDPARILASATTDGSWAAAVVMLKCDAAVASDAHQLAVHAGLPLAGMLHAGGLVADATLPKQTLAGGW